MKRFPVFVLVLLLAACSPASAADVPYQGADTPVTQATEMLPVALPTAGVAGPGYGQVHFYVGEPEIVFDYSEDTCRRAKGLDLPDTPARAVRAPDGAIRMISGGPPYNFPLLGPDFDSLEHSCAPTLLGSDDTHAYTFNNQEWLISLYRQGDTIHALVHNEYHDPYAENCLPGVTTTDNLCWYNAITYAASSDGGITFAQPDPPAHLVAALPIPWDPQAFDPFQPHRANAVLRPNPYGYMGASNIVGRPDGYFYALFRSMPDPLGKDPGGTCLMRTRTLGDPSSWRAWDGAGFTLTMFAPYDQAGYPSPTGLPSCAYVSPENTMEMTDSLTYNTYLGAYILIGAAVRMVDDRLVCGTFFTLSEDLIHWSEPDLLMEHKLPFPPCNEEDGLPNGSLLYPSLIDHSDPSLNFEFSEQSAYLYYVRWNEGLDRDLLRFPVLLITSP